MSAASGGCVLHVLVVAFHHKKGCQVEYAYPPLSGLPAQDDSTEELQLPEAWKCLPSLAMPDGLHNVEKDTILFLLPSVEDIGQTLYCVSCYRQISAESLRAKSADVTRTSVQKSVVVLCKRPLFGLMKTKLELITQAYFNELDFDKRGVLAEMYDDLSASLSDAQLVSTQILLGISVRDTFRMFKHRVLTIFKLILLEKRILISIFPVSDLCNSILSILSLFPKMIEQGLVEATEFVEKPPEPEGDANSLSSSPSTSNHNVQLDSDSPAAGMPNSVSIDSLKKTSADVYAKMSSRWSGIFSQNSVDQEKRNLAAEDNSSISGGAQSPNTSVESHNADVSPTKSRRRIKPTGDNLKGAIEIGSEAAEPSECLKSALPADDWGFPLSIFVEGHVCYPYASLTYLDKLKQYAPRGCVIGATNALFKQRKQLFDAIVYQDDKGELSIEFTSADAKRECGLSTADLRLMEFLLRQIGEGGGQDDDGHSIFTDNTSWEGGDEYLRLQLQSYLLSLYTTAVADTPSAPASDFHEPFVQAWRRTRNFRIWHNGHNSELANAVPGHPFAGQLSVSDMKLRMEVGLAGSESGRRLQQTLGDTTKYVAATTGKVKGALSSWWNAPADPAAAAATEAVESID